MSGELTGLPGDAMAMVNPGASKLQELCERFGMDEAAVATYVNPDEEVAGFGQGGSESLVLFVRAQRGSGEIAVRKVCGEDLSSAPWDPDGEGVMTPPSAKARCQVDYLNGLPESTRAHFPEVKNVKTMDTICPDTGKPLRKFVYDLSYVPGDEVSGFVRDNKPSPLIVARTHQEVMRLLKEKVHSEGVVERTEDTIESSYLTKIEDRLALSREAAPKLFSALTNGESITINGTQYRNIQPLLRFFRQPHVQELLEPSHHSLVMGDTNTENVKITRPEVLKEAMESDDLDFTYEDLGIMFIDPRAIGHNSTGRHTRDDYMYDNKPIHNTLGNYDDIHGEHFLLGFNVANTGPSVSINFDQDSPYRSSYRNISEHFEYIMKGWDVGSEEFAQKDPHWLVRFAFVMGTHFAAMPPFHFKRSPDGEVKEDPEMQKRAIAVYCEGIKWLNKAQEMMTGVQKHLYSVEVPETSVIENSHV